MKIAVVGAGISGITAAYLLQQKFDVLLFEKASRLGGHTNTHVLASGPDAGTAIDTGFIVFNDRTYPLFNRFLSNLKVEAADSDMSFSFYREATNFYYNGTNLRGVFAQPSNLLRPRFLRMLNDIVRFNKRASSDFRAGKLRALSLQEYLSTLSVGKSFRADYLIPMASAIWSASQKDLLRFPAETFVEFFENHGLLSLNDRPQWKTVKGGSHMYLKAFQQTFRGEIFLNSEIIEIRRSAQSVSLRTRSGETHEVDYVVLAAHADQTLAMLKDASSEERLLLASWLYSKNKATLHSDIQVLPPRKAAWASWNYVEEHRTNLHTPVSVSYHMNRLQKLHTQKQYCVTLNREEPLNKSDVILNVLYEHPIFTHESLVSQNALKRLSGQNRTFFCGAHLGYGFHEDGVRSGVAVAQHFDLSL